MILKLINPSSLLKFHFDTGVGQLTRNLRKMSRANVDLESLETYRTSPCRWLPQKRLSWIYLDVPDDRDHVIFQVLPQKGHRIATVYELRCKSIPMRLIARPMTYDLEWMPYSTTKWYWPNASPERLSSNCSDHLHSPRSNYRGLLSRLQMKC